MTEADRAVEARAARDARRASGRGDAILGEEEGEVGSGRRRWIVDPIDGTRNYSRGVPVWATLIALEEDGRVVARRRLRPRARTGAGGPSAAAARTPDGDRVHVSAVRRIEDAVLSFALEQPLPASPARAWHARGYGDFWSHMLVAEGAVDGAIDAIGVSVWDLAADPGDRRGGGRDASPTSPATPRIDGRHRDLVERPPAPDAARGGRGRPR